MDDDPTEALLSTVRALHPGAEVELTRRRARDRAAAAEYVVLPHRRAPKLLVPVTPAGATARSVRRFSADASYSDTGRRLAVSAIARAHGTAVFPDRFVVQGMGEGEHSLADYLSEVLGERVTFSIGIGTARVNRKPVLQVFDRRGRALAFVKLGDSATSRADVAAEAEALGRVAEHRWHTIEPPRLLHRGRWGELSVLVLSALPTSPRQAPSGRARAPHEAMAELAGAFPGEPDRLDRLAWTARQQQVAGELSDPHHRAVVLACLDALCMSDDQPFDTGAWHGDWTPWNMARSRRRVLLWDWERFETGVPVGLDACHYLVNAFTRRWGATQETVRAGLVAAGCRPDLPGSRSHTLGGLYLVSMAVRYLSLAEGPRGADIAPRGALVLEALAAWVALDAALPARHQG